MPEGVKKLQKFIDDPTITEVMVNGSQATFVEVEGIKKSVYVIFSEEDITEIVDKLFKKEGKFISYFNPYGDICLGDGTRINIITYPLARCGTSITVRKFNKEINDIQRLVEKGTLSNIWKNMALH
jgi:pilus assembly protein CpaF